jgi:hypothetical protein
MGAIMAKEALSCLKIYLQNTDAPSRVGDVMKILIVVLLCFIVLIMGCSYSDIRALSLWEDRQMDDDQRIYGSPYDDPQNQLQSVWLPTPY